MLLYEKTIKELNVFYLWGGGMKRVASEPYRVFFPVAILASVLGVMMWPMYYGEYLGFYPLLGHARVMIEGFVGGFAVGFLGTALPKMLGVAGFRLWQVLVMLVLHVGLCVAHLVGEWRVGDGLFVGLMLVLFGCVVPRVLGRKESPPAGMVLAGMGLLCGVFGAFWGAFLLDIGGENGFLFSQRLLYQGFILLPLLGVGSFMFPMILGTEDDGELSGRDWRRRACWAWIVGVLIVGSYYVEVMGYAREMSWCRLVVAGWWLFGACGCLRWKISKGVMAHGLRAGVGCLLLALLARGVMEHYRVTLDHILYIGGFGLITMIVATRVIFGHSGQGDKFKRWLKPLVVCVALVLLAMATRVSADFIPVMRVSHHVYAAVCWVVVSVIWGVAVLPSVRRTPPVKREVKGFDLMDVDFREK
ncbi:MAG: NnrS family protein [Akkermansiaceae bacterium]